jgi:hypothetical protein
MEAAVAAVIAAVAAAIAACDEVAVTSGCPVSGGGGWRAAEIGAVDRRGVFVPHAGATDWGMAASLRGTSAAVATGSAGVDAP